MRTAHQTDDGYSLVEVVVVVVLLGILGTLIALIFANTWRTQQNVADQTQATTRGQLIASEVERAMRNAVAFEIAGGGTILKVNTSLDGDRECHAFAFDGGQLRMTVTASPGGIPAGWPIWQDQVEQSGTTPYFSANGTNGIAYDFKATATDPTVAATSPVRFTGEAFMRNAAEGTMSPCW